MKSSVLFLFAIASLFISCSSDDNAEVQTVEAEYVIPLSDVKVNLPESEGKELVMANCMPCHSLRYIEMQPELSRATWEKTVHKMIATYGAPIPDTIIEKKIVDYLVAIKGKK